MSNLLFSVLIPTFERPNSVRKCVDALERQTLPKHRYEVIVVDDGGSIDLEPLVEPKNRPMAVRIFRQDHSGPAAARNVGLAAAAGRYAVFTDDDCCPEPEWLEVFAKALSNKPAAAIGGRTTNSLPENPYATASQILVDFLYQRQARGKLNHPFFTSNNLAFPAEELRAMGGFDAEQFPAAGGEDRDICARWIQNGGELIYEPAAVIAHAHPLNPSRFLNQHFRYGKGAYRFHRNRAAAGQGAARLEGTDFYREILTHPFTSGQPRAATIALLIGVSQVANAAGFVFEGLGVRLNPGPRSHSSTDSRAGLS